MTLAQQLPLPDDPGEISNLPFEALLARLESNISLLAEGTAPLDALVTAHQQAAGLLAEAERRLESLKARADQLVLALKS
jgi:exodeoxyribonuclease VII small subunit